MAILTLPTISRAIPATLTLDVTALLALESITDAYFADASNLKSVVFMYMSHPGNEHHEVTFTFDTGAETSLSSVFLASAYARDSFKIQSIALLDKDEGHFSIHRADLADLDLLADMDIALQTSGGSFSDDSSPSFVFTGPSFTDNDANVPVLDGGSF